jgi:dTDP-4-amino-4,6-dideoxygalactose transaminase
MIPRLKPDLGLAELFASLNFFKKNVISDFENSFRIKLNSKHVLTFAYGRSAIFSILKGLELENGEVICPSYTCVVVPNAIVTAGCIPVFVDSCQQDFNMDLDLLEKAITSKTVAIIATSIFGHPVDLKKLALIKDKYPHILIIQDCAHSFMVYDDGKPVHQFGDFSIFAMNISKIITSIFGGALVINNDLFYKKITNFYHMNVKKPSFKKNIRRFFYLCSIFFAFNSIIYTWTNFLERKGFLDRFVKYFDPNLIDMPKDYLDCLTEVEARVGLIQLKKLDNLIAHRNKIAEIYNRELKDVNFIRLPPSKKGASYSHYVILTEHAKNIRAFLHSKGVQVGELIDYHIPELPVYNHYKFITNNVANQFPGNVINLPVHYGVKENDAIRISRLLKDCLIIESSHPKKLTT